MNAQLIQWLVGVLIITILIITWAALMAGRGSAPGYGGEAEQVIRELRSQGVKPVPRRRPPLCGKGVWVWGATVEELGVNRTVEILRELGIKHVFLLVKGTSGAVNTKVLEKLLPLAHRYGIYVHAWIVCFVDKSRPGASPDSREYRLYLLRVIAMFLTLNASGNYVDGVHLDYIRYSGWGEEKWNAVSSFVKEVRELIDAIAPGAVLSIASKAESYDSPAALMESALYYGQNYTDLAKYVDLFCPMTYYLDYGVGPSDVGVAAAWIKNATHRPVMAGIQAYPCESGREQGRWPTPDELRAMLESCKENHVDGVVFFRLGTIVEKYPDYAPVIKAFSFGD